MIAQIRWDIILYVAVALAALTYIRKYLEIEISEFIRLIIGEFRELATANVKAGALNALVLVALAILLTVYFIFERIRQLIEIAYNIEKGPHVSSSFEFLLGLVLLSVVALLSVALVRVANKT